MTVGMCIHVSWLKSLSCNPPPTSYARAPTIFSEAYNKLYPVWRLKKLMRSKIYLLTEPCIGRMKITSVYDVKSSINYNFYLHFLHFLNLEEMSNLPDSMMHRQTVNNLKICSKISFRFQQRVRVSRSTTAEVHSSFFCGAV